MRAFATRGQNNGALTIGGRKGAYHRPVRENAVVGKEILARGMEVITNLWPSRN